MVVNKAPVGRARKQPYSWYQKMPICPDKRDLKHLTGASCLAIFILSLVCDVLLWHICNTDAEGVDSLVISFPNLECFLSVHHKAVWTRLLNRAS